MTYNNYLQIGEFIHCLRCHFNIPREAFMGHAVVCEGPTTRCKEECPDWAKDFNLI